MQGALPPAAQQGPVASRTEASLVCQPADARARSGRGVWPCGAVQGLQAQHARDAVWCGMLVGDWRAWPFSSVALTSGDKRRPQT